MKKWQLLVPDFKRSEIWQFTFTSIIWKQPETSNGFVKMLLSCVINTKKHFYNLFIQNEVCQFTHLHIFCKSLINSDIEKHDFFWINYVAQISFFIINVNNMLANYCLILVCFLLIIFNFFVESTTLIIRSIKIKY